MTKASTNKEKLEIFNEAMSEIIKLLTITSKDADTFIDVYTLICATILKAALSNFLGREKFDSEKLDFMIIFKNELLSDDPFFTGFCSKDNAIKMLEQTIERLKED